MIILYENLDYLELKIISNKCDDMLNSIVFNSNQYKIGDFKIELINVFKSGLYRTYDVSFFDDDFNQYVKIGSFNFITADTSKKGVFLTFYGLCLVNYGPCIVYDFLDSIGYNYNKYKFLVYRSDFCKDLQGITVQAIYESFIKKGNYFKNIPTRVDPVTNEITRFSISFEGSELRVYNKKLDILDRETRSLSKKYNDYLSCDFDITRVEVQLNRDLFSSRLISDIDDLYLYSKNNLHKKMNKYFDFNLFTKNIIFEKSKNYGEISYQREFDYSKKMYEAYFKKLLSNPIGLKYLSDNIIKQEIFINEFIEPCKL